PMYIGNKDVIFESIKGETLFVGIYCGIIMIMFFYNLFIFFTVKDEVYIYYVIYIFVVGLVQVCLLGYTYQFLWPNSSWLAQHSVYLLSPISCLGIIEFIKVFLRTRENTPRFHKGFHVFTGVYASYIVLDLFNLGDDMYNLIQLFAMLLSLYILIVAYKVMKMNYRPARFLFLSWVIFLIGVFVYALKDVGVLPYNSYTVLTMPIGSAIETALLSFALADRINILKKEKEDSQAKALELSKENEKIITEQKILLETKVKERTRELEETNRNLEETREQLINVEKMASLGQLTSGISHEINNPINFVVSNIQPLKRDIKDIVKVLEKYNEIKPSSDIEKKLEEITRYKNEIDLDYLLTEIDLLLKGIDEGASRTSEIVKGLKNFSRVHEVELQFCDIHEGLDSTLGILNSIITSSQINIVKQYGNFPQVECFPGKLNQVFMNILNNAVHAVGLKKYKNGEGKIIIKTSLVNDQIEIRIKDNGIGIAKANQSKIFEPFYTTKPVGAGTGLGLSIVYGIINSHNGTIEINSQENEGAEFVIRLPLRHERV
ncbi:MAG: 7TM diverse intracellular signaling domain-containing protein, partial [Bacteroidia bacterium]